MGQFLEAQNVPGLNHEKMEELNRPTPSKEIESL